MADLIEQGGWVLGAILGLSVAAWALIAWKWLELRSEGNGAAAPAEEALAAWRRRDRAGALAAASRCPGMLGRVLRAALSGPPPAGTAWARRMQPAMQAEALALRRHLPLIAALASVSTLLGLLGTVLGMVRSFTALTRGGAEQVSSLAEGVSQALVTTQAGLVVALPIFLLQGVLSARAEKRIAAAALYLKKIETARSPGGS
jgi:biopolymer transport protein ExbB